MRPRSFPQTNNRASNRLARQGAIIALAFACAASPSLARADAFTKTVPAYTIDAKSQKLVLNPSVGLKDLTSQTQFEGQYFRVVLAESETPIAFDPDGESTDIGLKAATAYNAMTQAKDYFKNLIPADEAAQLDVQITIRLEMVDNFSEVIHYATANSSVNSALSIGASTEYGLSEKTWGPETWFFKGKKVSSNGLGKQVAAVLDNNSLKLLVAQGLVQQDGVNAIEQIQVKNFSWKVLGLDLGVSFGLAYGVPTVVGKALSFLPSYVYLDSAISPAIAIDEYAHHALSPWFDIKQRFAAGEGYAHFYAAQITGLTTMGGKNDARSHGQEAKNTKDTSSYGYGLESGPQSANSSFTLGMLMQTKQALGDRGLPVVFASVKYLTQDSALKMAADQTSGQAATTVQQALMAGISDVCSGAPSLPVNACGDDMIAMQGIFQTRFTPQK